MQDNVPMSRTLNTINQREKTMNDLTDLTEFQQRAMTLAVAKMLNGNHFSVCDLREIAKIIGREQALCGRDFSALNTLHCVDWAQMGPDLARLTSEKCLELLDLPAQTIDEVALAIPAEDLAEDLVEKPTRPANRLRLAFWRSA